MPHRRFSVRRCRCRFAVIEEIRFTVKPDQHKTTTAYIAGFRVSHCQSKSRGYGGINRITPLSQNLLSY